MSWRKKESLPSGTKDNKIPQKDKNDKIREIEVYYEQVEENISNELMINNAKIIM